MDRRSKEPDGDGAVDGAAGAVGVTAMRNAMTQPPFCLTQHHRPIVLDAIRSCAARRGWHLLAAHVRTTHVHVILHASVAADQVLTALKAAASRALNEAGYDPPDRRRWTRHGSTRELNRPAALARAIHYVVHAQGEPMSLHIAPSRDIDPRPT